MKIAALIVTHNPDFILFQSINKLVSVVDYIIIIDNNSSNRETPFACARREFAEEVELELPAPLFISDTYVSESIRTITGRNIESRYWIYIIPHEISMNPPQSHPEVSNRMWVNTETCGKMLQHNNLFKQIINIVSSITSITASN